MPKITILLADDHIVVRESIRKFLEAEDYFEVIGEAGDGEAAVQMAKSLHPQVIIMDIEMPKLNGIEATRQVKKYCPDSAVLVLTAYNYEEYVFPLLEAGASGYLLKDISGKELIRSTYAVSNGEFILHPAIRGLMLKQLRANKNEDACTEPLTSREHEVLNYAARGYKNREIAKQLHVSVRTIEAHLGHIFSKLGVNTRTQAIITSMRKGLIQIDQNNTKNLQDPD